MWRVWVSRKGVCRVLVGKPEGRRPLGKPRRRLGDNIRMDLQEVGRGYMDWIGLAQDRDKWRTLVSAVMNHRVPCNAGNFLTSCKPVSFSRRTLLHGVITQTIDLLNPPHEQTGRKRASTRCTRPATSVPRLLPAL